MSPIARLYRFSRRRADGLVIATLIVCWIVVLGATQVHDDAAARRMTAEASR